jgi:phosphatidylserine/phosphatidylglycerophosphate/cardiolipin synthase-like enzyme
MAIKVTHLDEFKTIPVDSAYPYRIRTFYSPEDDVHGALKAILQSTTSSLVIAMYGYDDDELAEIIDEFLLDPAIHVQITLDRSQAGGVHEKAILEKYRSEMESNSVAIGTSEKGAIMHRKMVIVDGVLRVSGSTNWSTSGETKQDNEMTVIEDATVCAEARRILDLEHVKALTQMGKIND